MKRFVITDTDIDINEVIKKVRDPRAGAVNSFIGTVREWTGDKQTLQLTYEAYIPMAEKQMAVIADEIADEWPDVLHVAVTHRIGELKIGELAVVIAVSSPHRQSAIEATDYCIRRLKEIVPIWKKEHWSSGESWIGDQRETVPYPNGRPEMEARDDG